MDQTHQGQNTDKAHTFFLRAKEIAEKGNYDYAINMYIEGLRLDPDNLTEGHLRLRELALLRQSRKGKKPTMVEKVRYGRGKELLEQMLNAEFLLAKDPDHLPYLQAMLKAAYTGGYTKTTQWLSDLLFVAVNAADHPSVNAYVLLKDAYESIGQYEKAIVACRKAAELKPSDGDLDDEFKRLSAELTLSKGKYDQEGDFRKSIKDSDAQRILHASDGVIKSDDYRATLLNDARKQHAQNPTHPQNIFNLANALAQAETDEAENEAMELLEDAFASTMDFSFKQRASEIKINQLKRHVRASRKAGQSKEQTEKLAGQLNQAQLEHWRRMIENYPTNIQAKYEYADKLLANGKYDEAIPLFQEAQKDPRRKTLAMGKIGVCFFLKGWVSDAMEVFQRAIELHELKDDAVGKDLQYNLGLCYEKQGDTDQAIEIYRKIAQTDFGYRDVSKRVDKLRKNN
jgi:tetratricopeptide (TPR) repeat protein